MQLVKTSHSTKQNYVVGHSFWFGETFIGISLGQSTFQEKTSSFIIIKKSNIKIPPTILTANAWGIYRKPPKRPGVLQFELPHRVSSTGWSIYHSQAGFDHRGFILLAVYLNLMYCVIIWRHICPVVFGIYSRGFFSWKKWRNILNEKNCSLTRKKVNQNETGPG